MAELHDRQIRRVDLQQREVRTWIGTDDRCDEFAPVVHAHDDFVRVFDDVVVRQDVAVGRDDEARTERTTLAERRTATATATAVRTLRTAPFGAEEATEELVHVRIAATAVAAMVGFLRRADVDDRR